MAKHVLSILPIEYKIILPEFSEKNGWALHYMGKNAFQATHCYSEYTGKYENFELPYAIYIPDAKTLEANKGNVSFVIHMEHAGGLDADPLSGVTSSRSAVKLSHADFQAKNPAIVVVPQVEESRRSTDDQMASSEINTAVWQLIDSLLAEYKGYINEDRIYGTGQSMGGMLLFNMSAQRDNFFAGLAVIGAQWGNSYDKPFQHNNSPDRSPKNDLISFNGFGLDKENYQNWYYMVSDDNILLHTCADDPLAQGLLGAFQEYYQAGGVELHQAEWDPYLPKDQQEALDKKLVSASGEMAGSGIYWGKFNRGTHMSTWKYAYALDTPFEWLFAQSRKTAQARPKLISLNNSWLGRDASGKVLAGSGTRNLNTAQFTPKGADSIYVEGWTRETVTAKLTSASKK